MPRIRRSLAAVAFLAPLLGIATGAPGCVRPPTDPTPATLTLSGVVSTARGSWPLGVPIQGVRVQVEQDGIRVEAASDQDGRYTVSGLRPGPSGVSTFKNGFDSNNSHLTMISGIENRLDFGLRPLAIFTLSGVVSEMTEAGLVPVEGVEVNEGYKDNSSFTDSAGRYSVSELFPAPISFYAGFSKDGYQTELHIIAIDGNTRLDVQLRRR